MYVPDNWVIIKIKGDDPHYRVLAGWSGGYLGGDSWKLNSGITEVEKDDDWFLFHGSSGSVYRCHKEAYCLRNNNVHVWFKLQQEYGDTIEIMNEETDWLKMDWVIK